MSFSCSSSSSAHHLYHIIQCNKDDIWISHYQQSLLYWTVGLTSHSGWCGERVWTLTNTLPLYSASCRAHALPLFYNCHTELLKSMHVPTIPLYWVRALTNAIPRRQFIPRWFRQKIVIQFFHQMLLQSANGCIYNTRTHCISEVSIQQLHL